MLCILILLAQYAAAVACASAMLHDAAPLQRRAAQVVDSIHFSRLWNWHPYREIHSKTHTGIGFPVRASGDGKATY